jgi:CubicO group peptidase (beta-lactamase class C family)
MSHAASPHAQTHLPHARPEEIGLDARQIQVASDLLAKWTDGPDAPIPGASILVGRNGKVVPPRFFGRQRPGPDTPPIRKDALFLLASITKPVTYLGAMTLVDRGLLQLSERVTRFIPEFKAHGKEDVRVRQLFTHTSGLPDMLPDNLELRKKHAPLQRFLDGAVRDTELLFKPGTEVRYQSMGTAVVAEIVQRLTKMPIADFLKKEVFDPLGLTSTALGAKGLDRDRIVRGQEQDDHAGSDFGWNSEYWHNLGVPWGGLITSPEDFAVICQMFLNGGTWAGVRVLSPAAVRAMTTNRLNEEPDLPDHFRRTQPWGLGWRLNHPGTAASWGDTLGPDVYGHTGATGTLAWVDPPAKGFCLIFTTGLHARNHDKLVAVSNALAAAFV